MADCIGIGFPQFPCALMQMRFSIGENGCCHILKGGNSGGKEGKEKKQERRKGRGGGYRAIGIQVELQQKKYFV